MIKRNFTDASRFRIYEDKIHLSNRKNSTYFLSQKQTLSSKLDEQKIEQIYFFHIRSVVNSFIYNLFSSSSKRRTEFHLFGSRIIFFFSMTRRIKQSTVRETLYRQIVLVLEYFHRSKWEEWRLRDGVNICWFNGLYRILKLPWLLFFLPMVALSLFFSPLVKRAHLQKPCWLLVLTMMRQLVIFLTSSPFGWFTKRSQHSCDDHTSVIFWISHSVLTTAHFPSTFTYIISYLSFFSFDIEDDETIWSLCYLCNNTFYRYL